MGSPSNSSEIRRRDVMQLIGGGLSAGGMASLAGCSGDSGSGSSAFIMPNTQDFNTIQANLVAGSNSDPWSIPSLIYEPYLNYNIPNDEITYNLIDELSIDGSTLTFSIKDGRTWSNGNPVTSEDVVTQFKIAKAAGGDPRLTQNSPGSLYNEVSQVDEQTVEVELTDEFNERLITMQLFYAGATGTASLWTPTSVYGEYADAWDDASSESERETVTTDLLEFTVEYEDVVGNFLWQIEETSGTEFTFSLFEDHPESDNVNFDEIVMPRMNSNDLIPAARSNDITAFTHEAPTVSVADSPPSGWNTEQVTGSDSGGPALICNHQHDIYGMREVKQAFAHIVNGQGVAETVGEHIASPVPSTYTFSESLMDTYMGDPIEGNLNVYDSTDEAASLLESAGFTEEGGTWYQPNGNQFTPTIMGFNSPPFDTIAQTVGGQLSNFGIETEVQIVEGGNFFSQFPEGSYDLVVEWWDAGGSNPYFGMVRNFVGSTGGAMQYPEEVSVPPVGDMQGEERTVNVQDMLDSVITASTDEEMIQSIRELAWVANVTVPEIPTIMMRSIFFNNTNGWNWPESGSDLYSNGTARLIEQGEVSSTN